ncbi:MAG: AGE family epimerase/isomerase [Pseudomonadota bacterium]|nr:AGE family epimerase/isomerase [Pseudomonadota bacterium]
MERRPSLNLLHYHPANMPQQFNKAATRFVSWYFDRTLPIWSKRIIDTAGGGFHEALNSRLTGTSMNGKRIMVQARLCFTFAHASCLGRGAKYLPLAKKGLEFLISNAQNPEGGWRHRLAPDGAPFVNHQELYDHAFIIFAAAWLHRAGIKEAREVAMSTQNFLDAEMSHPEGGFVEALKSNPGPRRQNPHMHLLEAYLAWSQFSEERIWRDKAAEMIDLFERAFIVDGTLREYFTDDWRPVPGHVGYITEPGHHFEWIWLLHQFAKIDGNLSPRAAELFDFVNCFGVDPSTGGIFDEVAADGALLITKRRLWPQTEAIKAYHACHVAGSQNTSSRLDAILESIWLQHLKGEMVGGWREHLGQSGETIRSDNPGSSLYHLAMAAAELSH